MSRTDEPWKYKEERRQRAKDSAPAITDERRETVRKQLEREIASRHNDRRDGALPRSIHDPHPPLTGVFDLVFPAHRVQDHINGPGRDWLILSVMPRQLRPSGWVYLKIAGTLQARARVQRVSYREGVRYHTPNDDGVHDLIPDTATLEVDGESWQLVQAPAADTHLQGYRYARTDDDAGTITHIVGGRPTTTHPLDIVS